MSVNIVPGISAPSALHASEGDVGRTCEIIIIDGTSTYNIPSTATVTITATKPSGMGFTQACTVTENGTAMFETTASMTDESGKMEAEVRIVDGGQNIGTANLLWIVERNPHPSNVIDGDVERAKTILERAEEAMAKAEQMIEEVDDYNDNSNRVAETVNAVASGAGTLTATYTQGFWSSPTVIKTNDTLVCNKAKISVPAGCKLTIKPNGLYLLAQDASGTALVGQAIFWDGTASQTYSTGTVGILPAAAADRDIVFRIGKSASHSGAITPDDVKIEITLVRDFDMSYLRSLAGQISVTFDGTQWTLTPSDDFVAIGYKYEYIFARTLSAVTIANPSSGTDVVYYDSQDGTIKSDKASCVWLNSGRYIICYIYGSMLTPCECNIVADSNIIASPKNASAIISGLIWMYMSVGKLRIVTDSHARATYNDVYVPISGLDMTIAIASTSAVCLNAGGFYVKTIANLKKEEKVVAYVYNEWVTAIEPHIYTNSLPITGLIQREGLPIYINNDKIKGYNVASRSTAYAVDFGRWLKLVDAYNYTASPIAYLDGVRRIDRKSVV